jgi:hypothetical protein
MTENNNSSESKGKRAHCYDICRGGRSSSAFWGIFFIIVGLFWLGKEANWFSSEIMKLFWPFLFILAGTWFLASALKHKRAHRERAK